MYIDPVRFGGNVQNHEKMHMFARDIIRVRNPLDQDFRYLFDSVWYSVPANQTKDFERYLADRYVQNITDHILGLMFMEEAEKAIKNYSTTNPMALLSPYVKNEMILKQIKRKDDPELQEAVVRSVIVGLVQRFGEEQEIREQHAKLPTNTPLYKQLMDQYTNKVMTSEELQQQSTPQAPMQPVNMQATGDAVNPNPQAFTQPQQPMYQPPVQQPQQQQPAAQAPLAGTPPIQTVTTPATADEVTQA